MKFNSNVLYFKPKQIKQQWFSLKWNIFIPLSGSEEDKNDCYKRLFHIVLKMSAVLFLTYLCSKHLGSTAKKKGHFKKWWIPFLIWTIKSQFWNEWWVCGNIQLATVIIYHIYYKIYMLSISTVMYVHFWKTKSKESCNNLCHNSLQ